MARRWRNRPRKHAALSISSLEAERKSLEETKTNCEGLLKVALSEQRRRAAGCVELKELRDRLVAQGATTSVLGINFGHTKSVRGQIKALDHAILGNGGELVIDGRRWLTAEVAIRTLEQEMIGAITRLRYLAPELENLKSKERRKAESVALAAKRERDRRERLDANAHLAARARGEIRSESGRLRRRLRQDHPCPYCGGDLGLDMHADHIYPVAKGGLSSESNYVMVCQPCNQVKRDMTLNDFIDRMGFHRETILRRLRELGKNA